MHVHEYIQIYSIYARTTIHTCTVYSIHTSIHAHITIHACTYVHLYSTRMYNYSYMYSTTTHVCATMHACTCPHALHMHAHVLVSLPDISPLLEAGLAGRTSDHCRRRGTNRQSHHWCVWGPSWRNAIEYSEGRPLAVQITVYIVA